MPEYISICLNLRPIRCLPCLRRMLLSEFPASQLRTLGCTRQSLLTLPRVHVFISPFSTVRRVGSLRSRTFRSGICALPAPHSFLVIQFRHIMFEPLFLCLTSDRRIASLHAALTSFFLFHHSHSRSTRQENAAHTFQLRPHEAARASGNWTSSWYRE